MRFILAVVIVLILAACTCGQETHSVLVNPPVVVDTPQPEVIQPVPVLPRNIIVLRRGLFGWRAVPMTLVPAVPVVVQPVPRPRVIWTPSVIWR